MAIEQFKITLRYYKTMSFEGLEELAERNFRNIQDSLKES